MTSSVNNTMGRHTTSGVAKQGRTPRTRRGFNVAVEEHAAKNGFPSVTAARVDFCLRPATTARRLALSNARYLPPARVPHPHATASLWDTSRETAGPPPDCSPTVRLPRTRGHCLFSDESTPLPSIIVSSSLPAYVAAGFPPPEILLTLVSGALRDGACRTSIAARASRMCGGRMAR